MSEQENYIEQEHVARKIHDRDLNFLVQVANFANSNNGVTLLSKGALISGIIISEKEYYESVASSYGERGEGAPSIAEYFWVRSDNSPKPEEGESVKEFNFINLKNVKVNTGNSLTNLNGGFIRMKLEEVDGYILGTMNN
jgi:hypothetical protein